MGAGEDGPCQFPFGNPKRMHFIPAPPQQVSDPANYAIAGKILLAVAGAFAGVLLALVALHLYNRTRRRRLGGGGGGQRRLLRSLAISGGDDGAGAPPSPRGLDSAVLATIPVVLIGSGAGAGNGGGDCAVCLAELEPGEKARALPRCGHCFHVECIDAWFRGNATCPLCRADVVVVAPPGAAAAPSAPPEGGAGAQPEVRIDVAGDAVVAPANGGSGTTVAPVVMGRLHACIAAGILTRRGGSLLPPDSLPSDRTVGVAPPSPTKRPRKLPLDYRTWTSDCFGAFCHSTFPLYIDLLVMPPIFAMIL